MSKRIKYSILLLLGSFGLLISTGVYKLVDQGFYVYYEVEFKDYFVYKTGEYVWENDLPPTFKIIEEKDLYKINNTYPATYSLVQYDVMVYKTIDGKSYIRTNAFAMFFGGKYDEIKHHKH